MRTQLTLQNSVKLFTVDVTLHFILSAVKLAHTSAHASSSWTSHYLFTSDCVSDWLVIILRTTSSTRHDEYPQCRLKFYTPNVWFRINSIIWQLGALSEEAYYVSLTCEVGCSAPLKLCRKIKYRVATFLRCTISVVSTRASFTTNSATLQCCISK